MQLHCCMWVGRRGLTPRLRRMLLGVLQSAERVKPGSVIDLRKLLLRRIPLPTLRRRSSAEALGPNPGTPIMLWYWPRSMSKLRRLLLVLTLSVLACRFRVRRTLHMGRYAALKGRVTT